MKSYKGRKPKKIGDRRPLVILAAVVVIALIGLALYYYTQAPLSNYVYCGILQYAIFPAISISGTHSVTQNHTMTTMVTYTTTLSSSGPVGRTFSNVTTSSSSGFQAGVETICKYITTPSGQVISSTSTASSTSSISSSSSSSSSAR